MMYGKWMKPGILLLGMTMAAGALAAQDAAPAANAAPQAQSTMPANNKLDLSQQQREQLRQIHMDARDQAAVIRHNPNLTTAQKEVQLKQLRATTRQQMKSVLTPEQQSTMAGRRAARQEHMQAKLGLTADQKSKLKDLFRSTHQQRTAVLDNSSLADAQKLEQLKQIRQNSHDQLKTILTPEQLAKFETMRPAHRRGKMN